MADLSDLTTAELFEYVRANPGMIHAIANLDPRVKLMEEFYADPEAAKDLRKHGIRKHPDSELARQHAEHAAELTARDERIAKLEKRLDEGEQTSRWTSFRASIRRSAETLGEDADDATIDKIIEFMKDNDFGEKSAAVAVQKYYETREPAKPTMTEGAALTPKGADSAMMDKLLKAGPSEDLYALVAPDIERVFAEEFTGKPAARRPHMG